MQSFDIINAVWNKTGDNIHYSCCMIFACQKHLGILLYKFYNYFRKMVIS